MSHFVRFVRSPKGLMTIVILAVLGFAGQLYMMPTGESKTASEVQDAAGPKLDKFVTHATPQDVPPMALQTANGEATSLAAFRGDFLLVNFWATWCAPCRKEMPQLDALAARFAKRGVTVLALSVDRGGATKPEAFLNELGVQHMARAYDPSYKAAREARLIGLPTTLLLTPEGKEIGRLAGEADWDSAPVHALLEHYLAQ